jgi:hypothetical protein
MVSYKTMAHDHVWSDVWDTKDYRVNLALKGKYKKFVGFVKFERSVDEEAAVKDYFYIFIDHILPQKLLKKAKYLSSAFNSRWREYFSMSKNYSPICTTMERLSMENEYDHKMFMYLVDLAAIWFPSILAEFTTLIPTMRIKHVSAWKYLMKCGVTIAPDYVDRVKKYGHKWPKTFEFLLEQLK